MAQGNEIIVSGQPKGVFKEGIIATGRTPKPGVVMEIDAGVAAVGGRFTWQEYGVNGGVGCVATDGDRGIIAVLLPDQLQGKTATDAYAAGDRCFLYCPIAGEELNMLFEDIAGTGTDQDIAIGDRFIVDDGTGKVMLSTGSVEAEPFVALETQANITADTLIHCMFTGY